MFENQHDADQPEVRFIVYITGCMREADDGRHQSSSSLIPINSLGSNSIGDDGVQALAEGLRVNATLTSLE